jgi:uncharacterized secreted protein with C-terminal beta-propeller domain
MHRITSTLAAFVLVITGCSGAVTQPTPGGGQAGGGAGVIGGVGTVAGGSATPGPSALEAALSRFSQCDDVLDFYVTHALELVGPYGLFDEGWPIMEDAVMTTTMAAAAGEGEDGSVAPAPRSEQPGYSTTNVQVQGVDEPDLVKTDGRRIFSLVNNTLRVSMVRDGGIVHVGRLAFTGDEWFNDMLLEGDRLLLAGQAWSGRSSVVVLVEVDVADSADPLVLRRLEMDGTYVSARMSDGVVRVVTRSTPVGFEWATPEGSGLRAETEALARNKEIIRNSTFENWLPYAVVTDERTGQSRGRTLLDCEDVYAPPVFSGLATVSVLSIDLDGAGLGEVHADGLAAEGETIYASTGNLYVATQRWMDWPRLLDTALPQPVVDEFRTDVHRFSYTAQGVRYEDSGDVPGFIIGQWALSEHQGDLRVASTTNPWTWWDGGESQSMVTVLRTDGTGTLETIGAVDGLGLTEQIRAVRFMGSLGYVVTFRQTDPLYVIDLTDPTNPQVAGELKIPGYSAYLHPVGEGLLLGIGQDADEWGATKGTQVSLFDVSDPADPERIDQITFAGGSSAAEWDSRAFLWWEPEQLMLAPYERWDWDEKTGQEWYDAGALAIEVDGRALNVRGTLHNRPHGEDGTGLVVDPWAAGIMRTVIVDGSIYTIGQSGIGVHDLQTLDGIAYEPWA